MNRLFETFVTLRFLRGQGRAVLFNRGTRISFIFLALLIFVIVMVLSIFEGFQKEVKSSLWSSTYHLIIRDKTPRRPLKNFPELLGEIQNHYKTDPRVTAIFSGISVNALLKDQSGYAGKLIRALPIKDAELERGELENFPQLVHFNKKYLKNYRSGNYVIIGREMARYYNWTLGDRIQLFFPQGGVLKRGMEIKKVELTIAGFFRTGFYEYDLNLMYISLENARRYLKLPGATTELVVQLRNIDHLDQIKKEITRLDIYNSASYDIQTLKDIRGSFLAALQMERVFMLIIMTLLVAAGIVGIWITTHLLIKSKIKGLGMLRAIGMPLGSVLYIFTIYSMLIGLLAAITGGSIGIYVAQRFERLIQLTEDLLNNGCNFISSNCITIELIPRDIYYFDHLPVSINLSVIFGLTLLTIILSGIAGYLPARRAALRAPVESLRSE